MYLLDDNNEPVDAEFSLDLVDSELCVVVESSGGAKPRRSVQRRNPHYNKLLNIIFSRLADAGICITRVVLDSATVAGLPVETRVAELDTPYPVCLATIDKDEFRKMLGRKIAGMHRDPAATQGGNAQKRIRICLDNPVKPEQLVVDPGSTSLVDKVPEYLPGLDDTEREYLRAARLGQGGFRSALLELYGEACPVTGIANPDLLVASHIKPWSACTNAERLDQHNGILLSALIDRLFDRGLITFSGEGRVMVSPKLSLADRELCNLNAAKLIKLSDKNRRYLAYHRAMEFKCAGPEGQPLSPNVSQNG